MPARIVLLAFAAMLGFAAAAPAATEADPSEFFRRLESVGLKTEYLRALCRKLEFFYRAPNKTAEAEWGYILDNIYVPHEFKEQGSNRIRFDLDPNNLDTMIHELTHAAYSLCASEKAARGSIDRAHWEAVNFIWADIFNDETQHSFGMPRYPRFKANEVSAYFMGACVMGLFFAVNDLVLYNTVMTGKYIKAAGDAEKYGDKLILPLDDPDDGFGKRLRETRLGKVNASNIAYFENKPVRWEQKEHVKDLMWKNILGLNPPATIEELLERLNKADNAWIRGVRAKLVAARKAAVAKLAGSQAARAQDPAAAAWELRDR